MHVRLAQVELMIMRGGSMQEFGRGGEQRGKGGENQPSDHPFQQFPNFLSGSQERSIIWNNTKFMKGQNPDAALLQKMIGRLVLAHSLLENVLRTSGVSEAIGAAFIDDVMEGMHHASLDEMFKCTMDDDFRVPKARQMLAQQLPFLETIINQSTTAALGLPQCHSGDGEKGGAQITGPASMSCPSGPVPPPPACLLHCYEVDRPISRTAMFEAFWGPQMDTRSPGATPSNSACFVLPSQCVHFVHYNQLELLAAYVVLVALCKLSSNPFRHHHRSSARYFRST